MSNAVVIELEEGRGIVEGYCDSAFESVLDVFVQNFRERDEVGASCCVTHEGKTVVDLWGGVAFNPTGKLWQRDTVSVVFSSTKGITALVANMLIDEGKLDPNQPIAEIWPEFAVGGKEDATVRMALDHTVGVPAFRGPVKPGGYCDWDYMCERIAAENAFWEPGSRQGYHGVTFAWTVGELIRRVTGKSVGANIREKLADPLQLDLWCGLPEAVESRVAPMIPYIPSADEPLSPMYTKILEDPASIPGLFMGHDGGFMEVDPDEFQTHYIAVDERAYHAAEIPSANGVTNARGLAGVYRPFALGGSVDGRKFVGPQTLVGMEECSSRTNRDETLRLPAGFSLGLMKSIDARHVGPDGENGVLLGRRAFGHAGAGGSIGFADPDPGLSFGYTMNRMGGTLGLTDRGQLLVDAAYRALGYSGNTSGFWIRQ